MEQLKAKVKPEFLNRIDDIILFSPLTAIEIKQIVGLQFDIIAKRLSNQNIFLTATDEALEALAVMGFDPEYGGRPVKRVMQKQVLNLLSKELLAGNISSDKAIIVDYFDNKIVYRNQELESK